LGQRDITPSLTVAGEAGYGTYWNEGDHAGGPFFLTRAQYRFDPTHRVEGQGGYYFLDTNNVDNLVGRLQVGIDHRHIWLRPGFKRELKYDSFLSLVGKTIGTQEFGAARSNLFYLEVGGRAGAWEFSAVPQGGWVKARSLSSNPEVGFFGTAKVPFYRRMG